MTNYLFQDAGWDYAEIDWTHFPMNEPIEFEIINIQKVKAYDRCQGKYKGGQYYVIPVKMYSSIEHFCNKGNLTMLDIPARTFTRALKNLPASKKDFVKNIRDDDNLLMEIKKIKNNNFIILNVERRAPDDEMSKYADKVLYSKDKGE